ncbi:MAG: chromosome segregation protein SMC [Deltaproteobacteria bacterium]
MKIKSLEIKGFKSFYDKTLIRFDKELNAIVGPNGCGKSNILDAIRWILGEQNPRQLRANVMEEIISNGSEFLKPLGMAEVSLVMENVPNYNFEEVEIKRRVFRSGETEYYLNKVNCRLKDITDIFIDTGSGARAYSVIGQGRVDQMITAKPEEKRTLIEEVAGIRKYKLRRRETETRIKTTRENLSRIKDMNNEVKRQMDTLSLQAKHAKEFRELSDEARKLESTILRAKLWRIESKKSKINQEKAGIDDRVAKSEEEIIQIVNNQKALNDRASVSEESIRGLESDLYRTKTELNSRISSQQLIKSEISNIDRFIEKIQSESVLLGTEREKLKQQLDNKKEALEEAKADLQVAREQISAIEEKLAAHRTGFTRIRTEHQEIRGSLFRTLDEYSSLKGAALGHENELKELYSKKERIEKEISELGQEKKNTSDEVSKLERILEENDIRKNNISELKDELRNSLSELEQTRRLKASEGDSLKERLKESASRLNALEQIETNYEWLPEGIRNFILENKGNGVLGTVSDFISVPEGYEKAVEAALGEKIKWILVKEGSEALNAINSLRERDLGRGTFVPAGGQYQGKQDDNGVDARSLSEIVSIENVSLGAIENILGSVFLVPSLEEGLRLRSSAAESASFVTTDGDYLHSNGAISGGTAQPGVLTRKREIENLKNDVGTLETEIEDIDSQVQVIENEIRDLNSKIKEHERELIELGIKEAETKKDIFNLNTNLDKINRRIEIMNETLRETSAETGEKILQIDEIKKAIEKLDGEKSVLEHKFGEVEEKIQKAEEEEKSIEREISDKNVTCASLIEKQNGLLEDLSELEKRINSINDRMQLEARNIEDKKREKLDFIEKDRDTVEGISAINKNIAENEEKLSLMKNERSRLLDEIRIINENKESLNLRLSELRMKNNSLELDLNSLQIEIENIHENMRRNNLSVPAVEGAKIPSPEAGDFTDINLEEEEPKLRRLQARIEKFGPVNLLAPEEYNKLEERHNFLNEQMEDLLQALSSLGKAINKIDKESEKRFKETFEIMDQKFQEIFSRLFRGGEGKLVLTEPDNLLESGVEVMVRPRGKKFQSINLLSGGEKALSAIALIISACLIKPAPFLLFDEIDAPLDDRNTSYFLELVKEIDNRSQVIIITHNKKTMQEVNSLIGITSNKSGTSTVVSVDLN